MHAVDLCRHCACIVIFSLSKFSIFQKSQRHTICYVLGCRIDFGTMKPEAPQLYLEAQGRAYTRLLSIPSCFLTGTGFTEGFFLAIIYFMIKTSSDTMKSFHMLIYLFI